MLIKICGVCRPADAGAALSAGATHIGMIRVPGLARTRSMEEALEVANAVRAGTPGPELAARLVGVYMDAAESVIREEASTLGLDVAQLHGAEPPSLVEALRAFGLEVWKTVKPGTAADLIEAASRYEAADLLLVEGRSSRGHGGTGARFDWSALESGFAELRAGAPAGAAAGRRLGVAGGLTPDNVAEAVRRFQPALVDVSSGVESETCHKDVEKVRTFIESARRAAGVERCMESVRRRDRRRLPPRSAPVGPARVGPAVSGHTAAATFRRR